MGLSCRGFFEVGALRRIGLSSGVGFSVVGLSIVDLSGVGLSGVGLSGVG